jgi:hypothetical protein
MEVRKIRGHEHAQVKVIIDEECNITLVSYSTPVIEVDSDGWLEVNGLYSVTTRKHIAWFMREYFNLSYQLAKSLFEDNLKMNVHTGEVEEIVF